MKKFYSIIVFLFFIILFTGAMINAQSPVNYFAGKWDVIVVGTPQGDARIILNFEEVDGKLAGKVIDPVTNTVVSPITNIEQKGNSVTFLFDAQGYSVSLQLNEKDKNSVTGNMMGMFDASGIRIEK